MEDEGSSMTELQKMPFTRLQDMDDEEGPLAQGEEQDNNTLIEGEGEIREEGTEEVKVEDGETTSKRKKKVAIILLAVSATMIAIVLLVSGLGVAPKMLWKTPKECKELNSYNKVHQSEAMKECVASCGCASCKIITSIPVTVESEVCVYNSDEIKSSCLDSAKTLGLKAEWHAAPCDEQEKWKSLSVILVLAGMVVFLVGGTTVIISFCNFVKKQDPQLN